ncbi:mechanosensitive ion channel family protein [Cellulomonas sp. APG4]|uniref:mechanosensitive ion channel family protein n=1 Tax=Cellulomonas sp. APG4 TaxID=1538656 RepID=UPI00137A11BF|nr:mechanosensitive ion channel family protein [Cellulomonas sp. APG4]NCT91719.1 mechanosensitive ion channel family protein [Cellulomonas sp. APG4]
MRMQSPEPTTGPGLDDVADKSGEAFEWLVGAPLQSLVAVVLGAVALAIARWVISRAVRSVVEGGTKVRSHARRLLMRTRIDVGGSDALAIARRVQRAETMGSVLRSAAGLVVGIVVITAIANINDWDLGPVLASAGVVGVALGFGAQTLVKDFLSGLFMLVEDQYGVGDVVDLGEASGTVEAIGLRVTQVRDLSGTLWYVRNGEVLRVGNMTQGWSKAFIEVLVPPGSDVDQATALLRGAVDELAADERLGDLLLEEASVTAYEDLTAEAVTLRLMVKTAPAAQWEVQRELRARIRSGFEAAGVPLALPRREVLVEREVTGSATGTAATSGQDQRSSS